MTTIETTTRHRLLLAAESLFAERGIDAVSLAEITKAAGGSNTGAVHHHFGGREELLAAIVDEHRGALDERREELLDQVTDGGVMPAWIVASLVLPMVELLDSPRGCAFLSIQAQRALRPRPVDRRPRPVIERTIRLEGRQGGRPPVAAFLADLGELTAITALAQRARLEAERGREAGLGRDEFTDQLLAAITRIVTPAPETAP